MTTFTDDERELLEKVLSRSGWNKADYLNRNRWGYIIWDGPDTVRKVLDSISVLRMIAANLLEKANSAAIVVKPLVDKMTTCCVTGNVSKCLLPIQCEICDGYTDDEHSTYFEEDHDHVLGTTTYSWWICDGCVDEYKSQLD